MNFVEGFLKGVSYYSTERGGDWRLLPVAPRPVDVPLSGTGYGYGTATAGRTSSFLNGTRPESLARHAAQPGHGVRHGSGCGSHGEGTTTANVPAERDFAAGHRRDQRWGRERYESTRHLSSPNASCDPGSRPEWTADTAASGHSRRRQTPASLWLRSGIPGAALLPAARWEGCGCLALTRCFWSPCPRTTVRATSTRQVI